MTVSLIHPIIIIIDDFFVWLGGKMGVSAWVVLTLSLIIFYFYWNQIYAIIKKMLSYIGI